MITLQTSVDAAILYPKEGQWQHRDRIGREQRGGTSATRRWMRRSATRRSRMSWWRSSPAAGAAGAAHSRWRADGALLKSRGQFPTDEAASRLLYLALRNIMAKWQRGNLAWFTAMTHLSVLFGECFPNYAQSLAHPPDTQKSLHVRRLPTIVRHRVRPALRQNAEHVLVVDRRRAPRVHPATARPAPATARHRRA
jgi:hypothetical protein